MLELKGCSELWTSALNYESARSQVKRPYTCLHTSSGDQILSLFNLCDSLSLRPFRPSEVDVVYSLTVALQYYTETVNIDFYFSLSLLFDVNHCMDSLHIKFTKYLQHFKI